MTLMRRTTELLRFDPMRELEDMTSRLNRLFGGDGGLAAAGEWTPSVNVRETDKEYVIEAELPDVKKEDVHVRCEGRSLVIEGERKRREEKKGEKWHRIESSYGSFMRSFTLPVDADDTKIEARYENGMLRLTIPRAEAKKKEAGREIAVH